jgi:hypothetical protein
MPRRYLSYLDTFLPLQRLASFAAVVAALGLVMSLVGGIRRRR